VRLILPRPVVAIPALLCLAVNGCFALSLDGFAGDAGTGDASKANDARGDSSHPTMDAHQATDAGVDTGGCHSPNVLANPLTQVSAGLTGWAPYPAGTTLSWSTDAGGAIGSEPVVLVADTTSFGGYSIQWLSFSAPTAGVTYQGSALVASASSASDGTDLQFVIEEFGQCNGMLPDCYAEGDLTLASGPLQRTDSMPYTVKHGGDPMKVYLYQQGAGAGSAFYVRDVTFGVACSDAGP